MAVTPHTSEQGVFTGPVEGHNNAQRIIVGSIASVGLRLIERAGDVQPRPGGHIRIRPRFNNIVANSEAGDK